MEQTGTDQPSPQDSHEPPSRGGRAALIAPALILLLAIALRLYGIDWDQGGLFHPDERAILFRVNDLSWPPLSDLGVLLDVDESPLNPRWFPYGSLPIYSAMAAESLLSPFVSLDFRDLRFLGRGLSTLADVGTVLMVFLLGCRLYGRAGGPACGAACGNSSDSRADEPLLHLRYVPDLLHRGGHVLHGAPCAGGRAAELAPGGRVHRVGACLQDKRGAAAAGPGARPRVPRLLKLAG